MPNEIDIEKIRATLADCSLDYFTTGREFLSALLDELEWLRGERDALAQRLRIVADPDSAERDALNLKLAKEPRVYALGEEERRVLDHLHLVAFLPQLQALLPTTVSLRAVQDALYAALSLEQPEEPAGNAVAALDRWLEAEDRRLRGSVVQLLDGTTEPTLYARMVKEARAGLEAIKRLDVPALQEPFTLEEWEHVSFCCVNSPHYDPAFYAKLRTYIEGLK